MVCKEADADHVTLLRMIIGWDLLGHLRIFLFSICGGGWYSDPQAHPLGPFV